MDAITAKNFKGLKPWEFESKSVRDAIYTALKEREELIEKQQPKVSKKFIGKITARIYCNRKSARAIKTNIQEAFEEIGIHVA